MSCAPAPNNVGLEAAHAGFSGWGYLAGSGADDESVDLLVAVPADGQYAVAWRYATTGAAARALSVNGALVEASVNFPSTGAYTTYATVTTTAASPRGRT